jgi:hypothetical protein
MCGSEAETKALLRGGHRDKPAPTKLLLIPLQLPFPPMRIFAIRIKHSLAAAVQGSHDADAREHRRSAERHDQDQRLHGSLPPRSLMLGLRPLHAAIFGAPRPSFLAASSSLSILSWRSNSSSSSKRASSPNAAQRNRTAISANDIVSHLPL